MFVLFFLAINKQGKRNTGTYIQVGLYEFGLYQYGDYVKEIFTR